LGLLETLFSVFDAFLLLLSGEQKSIRNMTGAVTVWTFVDAITPDGSQTCSNIFEGKLAFQISIEQCEFLAIKVMSVSNGIGMH
jgi:hypothetical protein